MHNIIFGKEKIFFLSQIRETLNTVFPLITLHLSTISLEYISL